MKRHIAWGIATVWMLTALAGCGCQHQWEEATCTTPKTCTQCGETEGEALGHTWTDATCTEPSTCTRCGETTGTALGHDVAQWTEETPSTCWASPMNPPPIPAPEKSRTHKHAPPGANGIWGRWRSRNYLRFFPGRPEGFCRFRGEEGAPLAWDLPARWGALAGAECPSRWGRSGRSRHWGP